MSRHDPQKARQFALEVVQKLRAAGFEALWAGGCVRDRLMGLQPKDYDVATNATPEQIRALFGRRRTLAIGAAFGVITVLGRAGAGQIEVATFRRDAAYSDGRHPDRVIYSSAKEDALRRDFTINGLFHDPIAGHDIDYVGGKQDLKQRLIRAIGSPQERFEEDKLRMLRAVRFAATFDFAIEEATLAALREHADEITVVSAERIEDELRRMLLDAHRRRAVELLAATGLLRALLPEADQIWTGADHPAWQQMLQMLDKLGEPTFSVSLAVLLRDLALSRADPQTLPDLCRRWRLSNLEQEGIQLCHHNEATIRQARRVDWPRLQRVLISDRIDELMAYAAAVAEVADGSLDDIEFCRQKRSLPPAELNPPPLITGDDLKAAGLPPGPAYRDILERVRDAQLNGEAGNRDEALELARRWWQAAP